MSKTNDGFLSPVGPI